MRNNPRTLVYTETGLPVHTGDIVPDFEVLEIIAPKHGRSTGRVALREIETDFSAEYDPGVIGAGWIERFTIIQSGPIGIHPIPSR